MKKIIDSFLHLVMICKMTRKERRKRKELIIFTPCYDL
jgi:hypothetical protein